MLLAPPGPSDSLWIVPAGFSFPQKCFILIDALVRFGFLSASSREQYGTSVKLALSCDPRSPHSGFSFTDAARGVGT